MKKLIGWIVYLIGIFIIADAANFEFKTVLLIYAGLTMMLVGIELKK